MSDVSQGNGWWEAKDGKWYPPERHPDYKQPAHVAAPAAPTPEPTPPPPPPSPESDGWWKASDGNWYPPERHPSYQPPNPTPLSQQAGATGLRPVPAPQAEVPAAQPARMFVGSPPPTRVDSGAFAPRTRASVENDTPGNGFSVAGLICGVIAFLFIPPLFGTLGIVFGAVGTSRRESLGVAAIVVSIFGLLGGMFIGAVIFTNMM